MADVNNDAIIIGGFGASGSGALYDFMKEIDICHPVGTELRIFTDPDGIMSLESALIDNWSPYQSDVAIKRFRKLVINLCKKGLFHIFPYFRVNYNKQIIGDFGKISRNYADSLVLFRYRGIWYGSDDFLNLCIHAVNRIVFSKKVLKFNKDIYISYPKEDFYRQTRIYTSEIINSLKKKHGKQHVVFDAGYASLNYNKILGYFNSPKIIVVHRDPRDIFAESAAKQWKFIPRDVGDFIKWYGCLMDRADQEEINKEKVMRINFENLILDYERSIDIILSFSGIEKAHHVYKKQYLNPDVSKKNIGLWKKYKNKEDMDEIYTKLKKYCYE
ncbi:MAG: sulfotransferase [Elusimicrobia bacterium]|nr:sulfotransferase [Elusimicrobiota bacterium]